MIELFKDASGQWRYRVKARNGQIVAASEAYTRRRDAIRGANALVNLLSGDDPIMVKEVEG